MKQPFERVVEEHGATVLRVCRAILPLHDAQDAWSETFLAALKAYPGLDGDANVEAWLVTIAHRKAVDVTRATRRRAVPVETPPESVSTDGVPGSHDQSLWDAVARLPTKQRHAVAYHHLAGLPHKEVAAILDVTPAAARRSAADGIANLRRTFATTDYPQGART